MSAYEEDLCNRLKLRVKELNLFYPNGRFNPRANIPEDFKAECFAATTGCVSYEFKDRLYWILHDIHSYPICLKCGKTIIVNVQNFASTFKAQQYCNSSCRLSHKEARERYDDEREQRTGYRNPLQDPKVLERLTKTNLAKYGVKNVFQAQEIKDKITKKVQELYGVDNIAQAPRIRSKMRRTNLIRYGKEYPSHTEKGRLTCLSKYGVSHPMQDHEVFQRSMRARFKFKTLISPSGAELKYQGYEGVILKLLFGMNLHEADILVNRVDMPKIMYFSSTTGQRARYYPDIYIKSLNLLLEIKSVYTFNLNWVQALDKQHASIRSGFNHLLIVCNKHSIIQIIGDHKLAQPEKI